MRADLNESARQLLETLRGKGLTLTCAESCTGGLVCAYLTEIPGASDVVERGFVTYSNAAKSEMLGVPSQMIEAHGAVCEEVADAMAQGALANSHADVSVAVTGVAGPGGGSAEKPVGLVIIAATRRGGRVVHERCTFGDIGRSEVRELTVAEAFRLVRMVI
ncbi:nicotinamide-nucleotide amidohydrolase PncC [bacterium BMS3Bbin10]|nr:nicotinamide-nucleotide amidohydrolase PncC [bacterium BMS3Bbin10]